MSPSDRLHLIRALNALIRISYNCGLLDQASSSHPSSSPVLLRPDSPPTHPFFTTDRSVGITPLRDAILALISVRPPTIIPEPISSPTPIPPSQSEGEAAATPGPSGTIPRLSET